MNLNHIPNRNVSLMVKKYFKVGKNIKKIFYKDVTWAVLMLLPNIMCFMVFVIFPIIASFLLSFTEWDLLQPIEFIGLNNYIQLFNDEIFVKVLWNTIYFTVISVPLGIVVSLILAMALNQGLRGIKVYRAAYFLPVISSMVAVAIVWQWIYNPEFGIFNFLLGLSVFRDQIGSPALHGRCLLLS